MSASATIEVMEKLLRDLDPTIGSADAHVLATAAADVYLEHVDQVGVDVRPQLLATVLQAVVDDYRRP